MYVITGGGRDRQGRRWWWQPVRAHVTDPALVKVEKKCDWSRR